jgi:ABC-type transporter MlaC component
MGREALGQHWSSFTPARQKHFLPLFRELIERALCTGFAVVSES